MEAPILVAAGWLLFAGTHLGLATSRLRAALVARLGPWGFTLLFSLVAALSFSVFVHVYATHRLTGPAGLGLASIGGLSAVASVLIVLGIVLVSGALARLPASSLTMVEPRVRPPRGLERVTRHPFLVGVTLLCVGHVLVAAKLVGVVAFGGLGLLAIVGGLHQDAKLRALRGAPYADYLAATSTLPFLAIARGRQRLVAGELPWAGLVLGLGFAFVLRQLHGSLLARGGLWVVAIVLGGAGLGLLQIWLYGRRSARAAQPPTAQLG